LMSIYSLLCASLYMSPDVCPVLSPVEMHNDGNKHRWWKPGLCLLLNIYRNTYFTVESSYCCISYCVTNKFHRIEIQNV
jgi:hypothetical protein